MSHGAWLSPAALVANDRAGRGTGAWVWKLKACGPNTRRQREQVALSAPPKAQGRRRALGSVQPTDPAAAELGEAVPGAMVTPGGSAARAWARLHASPREVTALLPSHARRGRGQITSAISVVAWEQIFLVFCLE